MAVPDFQRLMRPVLALHEDVDEQALGDLRDLIAEVFKLTEHDRRQMLPSGRIPVLNNRVGWTVSHLSQAGALERTRRGYTRITDRGRKLLADHPATLDSAALEAFPEYLAFLNRGTPDELSVAEAGDTHGPSVWMIRAGRAGVYAPIFVERSAAILGWGLTGDATGLTRDELVDRVRTAFPDYNKTKVGVAVNSVFRVAKTLADNDLIVTPEPATRTILFGRVAGPYEFLSEPIDDNDYQHARPVRWFARVSRDELSYGARNSVGSMMTLTQPSYAAELLRLADVHASDRAPAPVAQQRARSVEAEPLTQRVAIPASAAVAPRTVSADFQTVPRRLMQLLDELDSGHLALPDFQRSFVWAPDATRELLVSMIRSFPAGALLFLQGGSETFTARSAEEAPPLKLQPSHLVLDGQQRLTSLYQAVFGVGASRFFLDIGALISGADVGDAVRVFSVERAASLETLDAQADALMMPLSAVRGAGAGRWRDEVIELRADEDQARVRGLLRDVEQAFIDPLVHYSFPVTVLPQSTELEAVCTIFETLNRTGKPLTPFELISARAFAGGHSLRDYWTAASEHYPVLTDFAIEPYYVLQVIALRLGSSCKRGSILNLPPDDIVGEWDAAVSGMAAAIALLRDECGVLIAKWIPYRPMLIPLAAAWREIATAAGPEHGARRAKLKRWFWCACFTGEYESSSASLAERDTPVLRDWLTGGDEPPAVADFSWDPSRWRRVTARQQGLYRATIALALTGTPRDFHTGVPLSQEVMEAGKVDDHHVFPRAYLRDIGRQAELDSVLNHCLIDRETNARIGKKAPSAYLGEIRAVLGDDLDRVLASHQLPIGQNSPLLTDDFDGFLTWRIDQLAEAIAENCGGQRDHHDQVDPYRARLDARTHGVELRLRSLVERRLEGDASLLPSHVAQRVDERVAAAARKRPDGTSTHLSTFAGQLEYFDLRELQDVITSKQLWQRFEASFRTKEAVAARFGQLAELRNALRHSRTLSEVTVKDGEAALLWFDAALA
ncbi:MAG: DUF262 domain-containing protein [Solirubrobacteraceae bacterium]